MKYLRAAALLALLAACSEGPTGPRDTAQLVDGWWFVTLANGSVCIARPYQVPDRDTAAEAIAECRLAAGIAPGAPVP